MGLWQFKSGNNNSDSMGECNTILSTYTLYMHLEIVLHPPIELLGRSSKFDILILSIGILATLQRPVAKFGLKIQEWHDHFFFVHEVRRKWHSSQLGRFHTYIKPRLY